MVSLAFSTSPTVTRELFLALLSIFLSSFVQYLLKSFAHFYYVICLLLLSCKSFYILWIQALNELCVGNMFFQSVASPLIFLMVSLMSRSFKFSMKSDVSFFNGLVCSVFSLRNLSISRSKDSSPYAFVCKLYGYSSYLYICDLSQVNL